MDPTANVAEQYRLAKEIQGRLDSGDLIDSYLVDRLVELVLALNDWMERGGFLPAQWKKR